MSRKLEKQPDYDLVLGTIFAEAPSDDALPYLMVLIDRLAATCRLHGVPRNLVIHAAEHGCDDAEKGMHNA